MVSSSKKVDYLVVDTTAFIQNAPLQEVAQNIITCPEVVNEITNKRQLKRLVVLPYDLIVKEAFPENVHIMTEFSKKTGDNPSLSATDIKVMALTYQLEKEHVGTDHLRKEPLMQKAVNVITKPQPLDMNPDVTGFYVPKSKVKKGENSDSTPELGGANKGENTDSTAELGEAKKGENTDSDAEVGEFVEKNKETAASVATSEEEEHCTRTTKNSTAAEKSTPEGNFPPENTKASNVVASDNNASTQTKNTIYDNSTPTTDALAKKFDAILNAEDEGYNELDLLEPVSYESEDDSPEGEDDSPEDQDDSPEDEDDDDTWITPSNVQKAKKQVKSELMEDKGAKVACMTTDFAMQNVLKQMNLQVAALDGRIIKQLRTFILRCYTCFKTTSVMTKKFCPKCGNNTLKKVAVSVDEEGKLKIHINGRKPLTARGKKFSLPRIRGGKHPNNPVLVEDQPMADNRPTRLARMKNNPLADDYIAGYSPFVMRDVNSRSAQLRPGQEVKYWMRKNPNEARRRRK